MQKVSAFVKRSPSAVMALGGALVNVAFQFGIPLTEGQIMSIDTALFAVIAVIAGTDINRALAKPPPQ